VLLVRPKIAELGLRLYSRSLHPELFKTLKTRTITRGGYEATVSITGVGHTISFQYEKTILSEVATSANYPLPRTRCMLKKRLCGEHQQRLEYRDQVAYEVKFELEPLDPNVFWAFQQELAYESEREGMVHVFDATGRFSLGAVSYMNVESRNRSLLVQTFHTFPEEHAIIKLQSQFQLLDAQDT
jgi:hypothetical protein